MERKVRVRFAPSPTGPLHLGGIRTALYNYLFAKKNFGTFILRIEDTDQNRLVPGAAEYIVQSLKWAGIHPDEGFGFGDGEFGPYCQSERKHLYKKFAIQLVESGNAYYAFDTADEIEALRERLRKEGSPNLQYGPDSRQFMKNSLTLNPNEVKALLESSAPFVIRFKMPKDEHITFTDAIKGEVSYLSDTLDDKVLFKSDGMPTYHLANVADDYMMQITHVIRGDEWLSSAPLHVMLYKALGIENKMPVFAHIPLILKPDGNGKLSKRDGDRLGFPTFSLNWKDPETGELSVGYKERGFLPSAFINFLALLGWNPGNDIEKMSIDEMINNFSLEKIHKSGARFDFDKAKWFNQHAIMDTPNSELALLLKSEIIERGYEFVPNFVEDFCGLMKERCIFLTDFLNLGYYFFEEVNQFDNEMIKKKYNSELKSPLFLILNSCFENPEFSFQEMETIAKEKMTLLNVKPGDIMPLFRLGLAGIMKGPGVFEMLKLFGKEKAIQRMVRSWSYFEKVANA